MALIFNMYNQKDRISELESKVEVLESEVESLEGWRSHHNERLEELESFHRQTGGTTK